jgi:hypothetical protein
MTNATATTSDAAQQAAIEAAMLLLDKLGITPADLTAPRGSGRGFPPSPPTCRWCRPW